MFYCYLLGVIFIVIIIFQLREHHLRRVKVTLQGYYTQFLIGRGKIKMQC